MVGTTISLLFAASEDFLTVPNLIVYSVLVTVTVLVFFLTCGTPTGCWPR
ncbi:MAG: hypothetical protein R2851_08750 [Caldilineaceae bacterium]